MVSARKLLLSQPFCEQVAVNAFYELAGAAALVDGILVVALLEEKLGCLQ